MTDTAQGECRLAVRKLLHAAFHLLDDSETNAQSGAVSIDNEIAAKSLKEMSVALDQLDINSHEDIDTAIQRIEGDAIRSVQAPDLYFDRLAARVKTLEPLLREWFDASDPSIGGTLDSLLERTRAALSPAPAGQGGGK